MLSRVPSVKFVDFGGTKKYAVSSRGIVDFGGTSICPLRVMVDGVMMGSSIDIPFDITQLPPPDQIRGIEVFAGPASIPVQYGGSGAGKWCGLIAVWTR